MNRPTSSAFHKVVRWYISGEVDLQPSGVTFPQDSVYQKLLKSVHVWQSYCKKQKGSSFSGHSVDNKVLLTVYKGIRQIENITNYEFFQIASW